MSQARVKKLQYALTLAAGLLILKVTAEVVLGYRNYFPADFNSDFLRGRDNYFFGAYRWAFYPHLASGPVSLILGMILISDRFRRRSLKWHRRLGRIQVVCILLLVVPSGFWMAWYAAAGPVAAVGFACLAVFTGAFAVLGLLAAVQRRIAEHRRWMWRCFLMLASAVVIRVLGGFATVSGIQAEWFDPLISWACWVVPLAAFEIGNFDTRRVLKGFSVRTADPKNG